MVKKKTLRHFIKLTDQFIQCRFIKGANGLSTAQKNAGQPITNSETHTKYRRQELSRIGNCLDLAAACDFNLSGFY